ncbi:MAG TPA: flagellin [Fimbriimonadaceae bacterium]|nr:flagellin [Fimbriimonadaceae bacterium]
MAFRINTNVSAMNALRNVSNTGDSLAMSITRLSTGLRINTAADDPAGLIISENFKAQLSGLGQAIKNSQDATNYAKTAEGALSEVNNLLTSARALAVAAGNTGAATSTQIQADQSQLQGIVSSITRIAQQTQFGTKRLLDGSSGINASVTDATLLNMLQISGTFGGQPVSTNGAVVMTVNAASTQATFDSRAFGADDTATVGAANAGSFTINGTTITADANDTVSQLRDKINAVSAQTGVVATSNNTGVISFVSVGYGTGAAINLADSSGAVLSGGAGYQTAKGTDGNATLNINGLTALFTASRNGTDGLTFTDADGNSIRLTEGANNTSVTNKTVGEVIVGSAQFQIGGNAGQTTTLSLGNFAASQLGTGAVTGLNLSNLDLTSASGASDAIKVIDQAISQVSTARGQIGSFQTNILGSNIRSLGSAQENLSATESSIVDTDVASEMTQFTKLQILQQSGMAVLAQANQAPQAVLSLIKGLG